MTTPVADHESGLRLRARELAIELATAGVPEPEINAELLVRQAAGLSRAAYLAGEPGALDAASRLEHFVRRRKLREPLAYILGYREFYGLEFEVGPGVLVPRPESELLVDVALAEVLHGDVVVDVGTGSGCLAVSVASHRPGARVVGVDASRAALAIAHRNAARHRARVDLVECDLLSPIQRADIVVGNLPYIPTRDIANLEPEVCAWEPRGAIDGGPDGLDVVRRLVADCGGRLKPRLLALEVGVGQAGEVHDACARSGAATGVMHDLAGIERMVLARWG